MRWALNPSTSFVQQVFGERKGLSRNGQLVSEPERRTRGLGYSAIETAKVSVLLLKPPASDRVWPHLHWSRRHLLLGNALLEFNGDTAMSEFAPTSCLA
jgi:hypothetical protein